MSRAEFRVGAAPDSNQVVVRVAGELDVTSAGSLRDAVTGALDAGHDTVVVDLSDVEFLDSSGLGAFVDVMKHLRDRGGRMVLASPDRNVTTLLRISGVDKLVPVVASVDDEVPPLP